MGRSDKLVILVKFPGMSDPERYRFDRDATVREVIDYVVRDQSNNTDDPNYYDLVSMAGGVPLDDEKPLERAAPQGRRSFQVVRKKGYVLPQGCVAVRTSSIKQLGYESFWQSFWWILASLVLGVIGNVLIEWASSQTLTDVMAAILIMLILVTVLFCILGRKHRKAQSTLETEMKQGDATCRN